MGGTIWPLEQYWRYARTYPGMLAAACILPVAIAGTYAQGTWQQLTEEG
jgi:hypothetical protein